MSKAFSWSPPEVLDNSLNEISQLIILYLPYPVSQPSSSVNRFKKPTVDRKPSLLTQHPKWMNFKWVQKGQNGQLKQTGKPLLTLLLRQPSRLAMKGETSFTERTQTCNPNSPIWGTLLLASPLSHDKCKLNFHNQIATAHRTLQIQTTT